MISIARLALIACLVWAGGAHAAGRVFYDGFESGNTNLWAAEEGRNKCSVVTSAIDGGGGGPKAGSKMAQCNWDGVVAWNDPNSVTMLVLNSWSFSSEFLIRFWVRTDADKDVPPDGAKFFRFGDFNNPVGGDMPLMMIHGGGTLFFGMFGASGDTFPAVYAGPVFAGNGWHKIEVYVQEGLNGLVKLWVDDSLTASLPGDTRQYTGLWHLTVMSNWSSNPGWEHDANNHLYWDDFEIYSDTGSGATGSMSDGTIAQGGGDTVPPTGVAITAPSNGATVSANTTVSASCTDNVAVANVQMLLDGGNLGAADTSSPYSISWDTTTASNGSHTLSARCTDTSSNQTTSSTISITISNSADLRGSASATSVINGSAYIPLPSPATFERRAR